MILLKILAKPINNPMIQLEAKGTHAITPERMGGPLIRELIDCIILQS